MTRAEIIMIIKKKILSHERTITTASSSGKTFLPVVFVHDIKNVLNNELSIDDTTEIAKKNQNYERLIDMFLAEDKIHWNLQEILATISKAEYK